MDFQPVCIYGFNFSAGKIIKVIGNLGVRIHGSGSDGSLDWTLLGRVRLTGRPSAPVQLAPAPHDHRTHLPLRKRWEKLWQMTQLNLKAFVVKVQVFENKLKWLGAIALCLWEKTYNREVVCSHPGDGYWIEFKQLHWIKNIYTYNIQMGDAKKKKKI